MDFIYMALFYKHFFILTADKKLVEIDIYNKYLLL